MFEFNPDLVVEDDDEAGGEFEREMNEDDEEGLGKVRDIDLSMFVPTECDGTGTKADREVVPTQNGDLDGNNNLYSIVSLDMCFIEIYHSHFGVMTVYLGLFRSKLMTGK